MKTAITGYVVMILLALTTILTGSYIAMHLETVAAREYNTAVIDRIQASNFSPNIIDEIKSKSVTDGYPTTITDVTLYEDKKDVLVSTKYTVRFPFLGVEKNGVVEGYAR